MTADPVLRVATTDLVTGEVEEVGVRAGEFLLTTTEPCYVAHSVWHKNGTVVLTIKGLVAR